MAFCETSGERRYCTVFFRLPVSRLYGSLRVPPDRHSPAYSLVASRLLATRGRAYIGAHVCRLSSARRFMFRPPVPARNTTVTLPWCTVPQTRTMGHSTMEVDARSCKHQAARLALRPSHARSFKLAIVIT